MFHIMFAHYTFSSVGLLSGHLLENSCRSVSNLFSLYFGYLQYLFISRSGFKSGVCLLIAPVPVHCFSITFIYQEAAFIRLTSPILFPQKTSVFT